MTALEVAADADGPGREPVCKRTLEVMRRATAPWNPAHHEVWPVPFLRAVKTMQMVKTRIDRIAGGVQEEQGGGGGGGSATQRARVSREVEVLSAIDGLLFVHHIMSFCGRDWFS